MKLFNYDLIFPNFSLGIPFAFTSESARGIKSAYKFLKVLLLASATVATETFTVRKISYGIGVERVFPLHSPMIAKVEVVTRGRVRRAKLHYLRALRGKASKIREKRTWVTQTGSAETAE